MTDVRELMLCPFCGEQDSLRTTKGPVPGLWGVTCYGCGCFLDARVDTEPEAVERWNHRAELRPNHAYRVGVAVGRSTQPQAGIPCMLCGRVRPASESQCNCMVVPKTGARHD